ncbi:MAG: hypothetical protein HN482_09165 [Bdellovibrionales bacterium]|nr:hypothetical protein [Bdellovibrionales bacterium]
MSSADSKSSSIVNDEQLLLALTPFVIGCVWLLDRKLEKFIHPFDMINYLSDGQLINIYNQYQEKGETITHKGLYITKSYGEEFFVAQLSPSDKEGILPQDISELLKIISANAAEGRNKLLVIDINSNSWNATYEKDFPQIEFEYLNN